MILAIDTAASLCAACVWRDGVVLGRESLDIGKGHAEALMGVIESALGQAGRTYADVERIAVSIGPGSFTGVRVGVATARGLALALRVPAVGVTTLAALAAEARDSHGAQSVLSVIDAKRDEIYAALYGPDGAVLRPPAALSLQEAVALAETGTILAGTAARMVAACGGTFTIGPQSATAEIAFYAALAQGIPAPGKPKPLYLRLPDVRPQSGFALPRTTDTR